VHAVTELTQRLDGEKSAARSRSDFAAVFAEKDSKEGRVVVVELKYFGDAQAALEQAKEKQYPKRAWMYMNDSLPSGHRDLVLSKEVYCVGLSYSIKGGRPSVECAAGTVTVE